MNRIKLKFLTIALISIILTLVTQATLAFYTTIGRATNVITSGEIKLAIHEKTDQGKDFPAEGVYVMPGAVVGKSVTVENVCQQPFYLRVQIVSGVESSALSAEECFKLNIDEEHWVLHDGWYYYTGIVDPGETTPNVFSHVEIVGSKVDNSYLGKTLTLSVVAHAVQSENNPVEGTDTFTASGWPEE